MDSRSGSGCSLSAEDADIFIHSSDMKGEKSIKEVMNCHSKWQSWKYMGKLEELSFIIINYRKLVSPSRWRHLYAVNLKTNTQLACITETVKFIMQNKKRIKTGTGSVITACEISITY